MKKIFIMLVLLVLGVAPSAHAAAPTKVFTDRFNEVSLHYPSSWHAIANHYLEPIKQPTNAQFFAVVNLGGNWDANAVEAYDRTGWKGFIDFQLAASRDAVKHDSSASVTTRSGIVNGMQFFEIISKSFVSKAGLTSDSRVIYVRQGGMKIYWIGTQWIAIGKKTIPSSYVDGVETMLQSLHPLTGTTKVLTQKNRHLPGLMNYSLRYPAWWTATSAPSLGILTLPSTVKSAYRAEVDVTTIPIDETNTLNSKTWWKFVTSRMQYEQGVLGAPGIIPIGQPTPKEHTVTMTDPVPYGLNGYIAAIATFNEPNGQRSLAKQATILVTKDYKTVYEITFTERATSKRGSLHLPSVLQYDFRALAQSFRIL